MGRIQDGARDHVENFVKNILQLPHPLVPQREYYEHGKTLQEKVQSLIEEEFKRMTDSNRSIAHSPKSRNCRLDAKIELQGMYEHLVMQFSEAVIDLSKLQIWYYKHGTLIDQFCDEVKKVHEELN